MIPIGIVTRDRVPYLDTTLRSLSATTLPHDISLTVFDDASAEESSRLYYTTDKLITVETHWPTSKTWNNVGLGVINQQTPPTGLAGRVFVESLDAQALGVVNASCRAICRLFERNPTARGILLLQDDVIFKDDWYERMMLTVSKASSFTHKPLGLLAGIKINYRIPLVPTPKLAVASGITAQCLYVSRPLYTALRGFFNKEHQLRKKFDDTLRRETTKAGFWGGCIYPFVCQHFGIKSIVRPGRSWYQGAKGRIGYYVHPPYALADAVKRFGK